MRQPTNLNLNKIPEPPYALVVCEKPSVAFRIAQALGTSHFAKIIGLHKNLDLAEKRKCGFQPTVFLAISQNEQSFVVCSALGHLYALEDVNGNRNAYPVFDVKWSPISRKRKGAQRTAVTSQVIIKSISLLSKRATSYIHACDYDQEGEVIGYNILEYACNNMYECSSRAKYSTLTDQEIRDSFDNLLPPSKRLAEAGRARHIIDFFYGINLSRALARAYKNSSNHRKYHNLSIGRVQGPTLAFVVDKELSIKNHVPVPYWTINAEFEKDGHIIIARYYRHKILALSEADTILQACSGKDGEVTGIKNQKNTLYAPHPFNLGDLQKQAYRIFGFSPSYTLAIAEKLYISALISYPRTSSQRLPSSLNYRKIISDLSKFVNFTVSEYRVNSKVWRGGHYSKLSMDLLSNSNRLLPNNGEKTDPAHPAIYPTGEKPRVRLSASESKIFHLIAMRFLATFGPPAMSEHITVTILITEEYPFEAHANMIIDEGWIRFYRPYVSVGLEGESQSHLRNLRKGNILKNNAVTMTERVTQPPSRFNQSSLLEEMESKNIGTKATRSAVISTLFKRNYITNVRSSENPSYCEQYDGCGSGGIKATDLGVEIVQCMRQYIPNILSTDLTRSMEDLLERIASGNDGSDSVIEYAKTKLTEAIVPFKEKEIEIGNRIADAVNVSANKQQAILGTCPICSEGILQILRSSKTKKRFVGCSNYRSGLCQARAPLPQRGSIRPTGKICSSCQWPLLEGAYDFRGRHRWKFCINTKCSSKECEDVTQRP